MPRSGLAQPCNRLARVVGRTIPPPRSPALGGEAKRQRLEANRCIRAVPSATNTERGGSMPARIRQRLGDQVIRFLPGVPWVRRLGDPTWFRTSCSASLAKSHRSPPSSAEGLRESPLRRHLTRPLRHEKALTHIAARIARSGTALRYGEIGRTWDPQSEDARHATHQPACRAWRARAGSVVASRH